MAKIKAYVISCSSDGDVDVDQLFIWGEIGQYRSLSETRHDAKKRMLICRKQMKCNVCDAEIHEIEIERTARTYGGWVSENEDTEEKERRRIYRQKYYRRNKEKYKEYQKVYRERNKEKFQGYQERYRQKQKI